MRDVFGRRAVYVGLRFGLVGVALGAQRGASPAPGHAGPNAPSEPLRLVSLRRERVIPVDAGSGPNVRAGVPAVLMAAGGVLFVSDGTGRLLRVNPGVSVPEGALRGLDTAALHGRPQLPARFYLGTTLFAAAGDSVGVVDGRKHNVALLSPNGTAVGREFDLPAAAETAVALRDGGFVFGIRGTTAELAGFRLLETDRSGGVRRAFAEVEGVYQSKDAAAFPPVLAASSRGDFWSADRVGQSARLWRSGRVVTVVATRPSTGAVESTIGSARAHDVSVTPALREDSFGRLWVLSWVKKDATTPAISVYDSSRAVIEDSRIENRRFDTVLTVFSPQGGAPLLRVRLPEEFFAVLDDGHLASLKLDRLDRSVAVWRVQIGP